jgi:DNA-binding response OmpR family regulator
MASIGPEVSTLSACQADYVLVIDDEAICGVMELALDAEGYEVACLTDPVAALGLIVERPPRLILLDLRMPTRDGESFVRAYRALPSAAAPIVVFSALPNAEDYAARIGAAGSIAKPFNLDDLLAAVSRALPLRAPRCDVRFAHGRNAQSI